jgi:hypothetical protein
MKSFIACCGPRKGIFVILDMMYIKDCISLRRELTRRILPFQDSQNALLLFLHESSVLDATGSCYLLATFAARFCTSPGAWIFRPYPA